MINILISVLVAIDIALGLYLLEVHYIIDILVGLVAGLGVFYLSLTLKSGFFTITKKTTTMLSRI